MGQFGVGGGIGIFIPVVCWLAFLIWWKQKPLRKLYQERFRDVLNYQEQRVSAPSNNKRNLQEHEEEFRILSQTSPHSECSVGKLPGNLSKNRYTDIVPYDRNRVVLQGAKNGDYINASNVGAIFIATQDPMPDQDEDVWLMLWRSEASVVIRLSPDVKEFPTAQYIPNIENDAWVFGAEEIKVTTLARHHLNGLQVTKLKVEKEGVSRNLIHFHLSSWKAGSTASTDDVLEFVTTAQLTWAKLGGKKVVVHCGAGSGRTGTIIALWLLIREVKEMRDPSVFNTVAYLRGERPGMVQTMEQYSFLHRCLNSYISKPHSYLGTDVLLL